MELIEEKLKTLTSYHGVIVNVRLDEARLPDGSTAKREVVEHPGGVTVLPLEADGTVCKGTYHFFLCFAGFQHFIDVLCLWHRKVQHIRCLHICGFFEQRNQLRQIEEPGKTCFRTVAGSFGVEFVKILFVDFLN